MSVNKCTSEPGAVCASAIRSASGSAWTRSTYSVVQRIQASHSDKVLSPGRSLDTSAKMFRVVHLISDLAARPARAKKLDVYYPISSDPDTLSGCKSCTELASLLSQDESGVLSGLYSTLASRMLTGCIGQAKAVGALQAQWAVQQESSMFCINSWIQLGYSRQSSVVWVMHKVHNLHNLHLHPVFYVVLHNFYVYT